MAPTEAIPNPSLCYILFSFISAFVLFSSFLANVAFGAACSLGLFSFGRMCYKFGFLSLTVGEPFGFTGEEKG